jgi:hypothetical protein
MNTTGPRILLLGAGGVGEAIVMIARRRSFFAAMVVADIDGDRAQSVAARGGDERFTAVRADAGDEQAIAELARAERADVVLNACDPRFNPPIFAAALAAGCTYLDMAMRCPSRTRSDRTSFRASCSATRRSPSTRAGRLPGSSRSRASASSPACRTSSRATAPDALSRPHRRGRRARRRGPRGRGLRLRPDVLHLDDDRGVPEPTAAVLGARPRPLHGPSHFSVPRRSRSRRDRPVECVNVEHEEVVLVPRWVDCEG